ncbi:hypothetical protein YDYSG_00660 [Paenibacillus tyrfis]|uniref:DUF4179 domain-containing protein n=1 Tax=Paenibacillus tyrfis TaxID=1501230 RepID=UPI0024928B41|nr:DUF4179 domain-containing protein [Paenibacillus tyrfis]GLI04036.1 hypothetical protein YDYSG_00660 [Paenibacillus tyrfis]
MKCVRADRLAAELNQDLSPFEARQWERHLESCADCRNEMERLLVSLDDFDPALEEVQPDDGFTQAILDRLDPYVPGELPQAAEAPDSAPKRIDWKKRSVDILKKVTIVVAGLAVAISLGTFVSPTFADYVKSIFSSSKDVDQGIKEAVKQGFSKQLDLNVTDQGVTLRIKEVLADTLRIAVMCEAIDQNGNKIDFDLLKPGERKNRLQEFVLKDKNGKPLFKPEEGGWTMRKEGEYMMIRQELTELTATGRELPDELTAEVHWAKLDGKEGSWKLTVPIDMAEAKRATKTVAVNQQYTSPQGLKIDFKKVDFAPSAMLLSLETQLTPEVRERQKQIMKQNGLSEEMNPGPGGFLAFQLSRAIQEYKIAYELVDEQGKVVAAQDDGLKLDKDLSIEKNTIVNGITGMGTDEVMQLWHTFVPMSGDRKLTFRLHSVYTNELANFSAKLKPAQLQQKPVQAEDQGTRLTFSNFVMKTDPAEAKVGNQNVSGTGGVIEVQAELAKDVVGLSLWQVKDETGKEYEARLERTSTRNADGTVSQQGVLVIPQLEKEPKELTVTYKAVQKQHRDVKWEVPITAKP